MSSFICPECGGHWTRVRVCTNCTPPKKIGQRTIIDNAIRHEMREAIKQLRHEYA